MRPTRPVLMAFLAVLSIVPCLGGCGGASPSGPTSYRGVWTGQIAGGGSISFSVNSDNEVNALNVFFPIIYVDSLGTARCDLNLWQPGYTPISGLSFEVTVRPALGSGPSVTVRGAFSSPGQASGTVSAFTLAAPCARSLPIVSGADQAARTWTAIAIPTIP